MKKLTPTSYALLSLLSRRPWSAYELNKHMQNSVLRAYWPRAESHVYSEPKKLVSQGLASMSEHSENGRSRKIYKITENGKEALSQWINAPTNGDALLQFEGMLKFISADNGDKASLLQNLYDIRRRALMDAQEVINGIQHTSDNSSLNDISGMPFNAMSLDFLVDLIEARINWVDRSIKCLQDIETTADCDSNRELGEHFYDQTLKRLAKLLSPEPYQ